MVEAEQWESGKAELFWTLQYNGASQSVLVVLHQAKETELPEFSLKYGFSFRVEMIFFFWNVKCVLFKWGMQYGNLKESSQSKMRKIVSSRKLKHFIYIF